MYPELFKIGPLTVHSYGLMLGLAFLVGTYILSRELKRVKIDETHGIVITFLGAIGGLIGGKIFYIIEEWNFGRGLPFKSLLSKDVLFSPSGLTFYGGLILAIILIYIYCKIKKISILHMFDLLSPAAALGYGVARIGCHLSGDGCYGIIVNNTSLEFLGCDYSKGIYPTTPPQLALPTPLFELLFSVIIFLVLWRKRKHIKYYGQLFYMYLILIGTSRFIIEFFRNNPRIFDITKMSEQYTLGITQAQIISIIIIIMGLFLLYYKNKQQRKSGLKNELKR